MGKYPLINTPQQRRTYQALWRFLLENEVAVGERLPPFPQLAVHLQVTVKLLRLVIPIMVAEGLLEVVPHVGTFCRRRPEIAPYSTAAEHSSLSAQPVSSSREKTHIRLYVNEYDDVSGHCWRTLIHTFEEWHPECYVEISQQFVSDTMLKGADVLVMESIYTQTLARQGALLDWVTEETAAPDKRLAAVADSLYASNSRSWLPISLGMQLLYVHKAHLRSVGLYHEKCWQTFRDILTTCEAYAARVPPQGAQPLFGCVLEDFHYPMIEMGLWSGAWQEAALRFLLSELAAFTLPRLVTPADITGSVPRADFWSFERWILDIYSQHRALFVYGHAWQHRYLDGSVWDIRPIPIAEQNVVPFCNMAVSVSAHAAVPELAIKLARFIAGPVGQQVLNTFGISLPTHLDAVEGNTLLPFYQQYEQCGWVRESLLFNERYNETVDRIREYGWEVRARRMAVDDAVAALRALDTRMTVVRPAGVIST